jgi:hypothetical protein
MRIKTYTGARRVGTGRVSQSSLPVRPLWFQSISFAWVLVSGAPVI